MHLFTQLFRPDLYFTLCVFSIRVPGCNFCDIISVENRKNSHTQICADLRTEIIEKLLIDI